MKDPRLKRLNVFVLVAFSLLGIFLGGAVVLVIWPFKGTPAYPLYAILWAVDALVMSFLVGFIVVVFYKRQRMIAEHKSTQEVFQDEHFVYTEAILKEEMERLYRRKKFNGVLGALSVKNVNGEILELYGATAVKQINEIALAAVKSQFGNRKGCVYAFNMLDGFLIYLDTTDYDHFYQELREVAATIHEKAKGTGSLPILKILMGACVAVSPLTPNEVISKALFALTDNASTRLENDVIVYRKGMERLNSLQRMLATQVYEALEKDQFEVYYQPKIRLKDQVYYGAEGLIRWHHPQRGLLPPSLFIPFAENSGAIVPIDYYVFKKVCEDIKTLRDKGMPLLTISVNISRKTIYDPRLFDFFKKTIAEYEIDPKMIEIELTESIAAHDNIYIATAINKLRDMGFRTAIDDFGVGYSSFSTLKKIRFNTLKVDKTFIDDIEIDEKSRSMVRQVIEIGHSLGMEVVGEGVQSKKQTELLKAMKLDCIQGFYYSLPLSFYDYGRFLGANCLPKKKTRTRKAKA
jgi:EAL domain-containing protein (putative c-di-GMP-specific phosphodiesterase class I)